MIKIIKKYKKLIVGLGSTLAMVCMFFAFSPKTNAYYFNSNGNIVGENLANVPNFTANINNDYYYDNVFLMNITESNTYTLHFDIEVVSGSTDFVSSVGYGDSSYSDDIITLGRNGGTFTTTTSMIGKKLFGRIPRSTSNPITGVYKISNVMFNKGDVAKPYEPYGEFYSQNNYDNYGESQYNQGYSDNTDLQTQGIFKNSSISLIYAQRETTTGFGYVYDTVPKSYTYTSTAMKIYRGLDFTKTFNLNPNEDMPVQYFIRFSSPVASEKINLSYDSSSSIGVNFKFFYEEVDTTKGSSGILNNNKCHEISIDELDGSHLIKFDKSFMCYGILVMNSNIDYYCTRLVDNSTDYQNGYNGGYADGLHSNIDSNKESWYNDGYSHGKEDGFTQGSQSSISLYGLFGSIAQVPVTIFGSIFNFELFGMNIFAALCSILSLLLVVWVIRKFI